MCVQYCWRYHEYRGGYLEYRREISWCTLGGGGGGGDIMSTVGEKIFTIVTPMDPSSIVWSVIHVWDPPLNYHQNSKFIGIMWSFVWDPFKMCFWAASSLSSLQQTSRVSYGTHLYKYLRAASTLLSLQQTLRSSIWDPLGQMFGVASTLLSLNQTPRVSWGCIWDPPKNFLGGSSCTILAPVGPRASFGSPLWFT